MGVIWMSESQVISHLWMCSRGGAWSYDFLWSGRGRKVADVDSFQRKLYEIHTSLIHTLIRHPLIVSVIRWLGHWSAAWRAQRWFIWRRLTLNVSVSLSWTFMKTDNNENKWVGS